MRLCEFGDVGSGKTLGLVKEAYRYHKQFPNNLIYSNIDLFFRSP